LILNSVISFYKINIHRKNIKRHKAFDTLNKRNMVKFVVGFPSNFHNYLNSHKKTDLTSKIVKNNNLASLDEIRDYTMTYYENFTFFSQRFLLDKQVIIGKMQQRLSGFRDPWLKPSNCCNTFHLNV